MSANLDVLELGCGTGLAGRYLRPRARMLAGIDLSTEMVEKAQSTGLYDALEVIEITSFLDRETRSFDLIAACDTLIYFGDLRQVILPAALRLRNGGFIAFTVERGNTAPFCLTDSGRYSHTASHIAEIAADARLSVVSLSEGFLRNEYGIPVTGLIALLQKRHA
jgi:predicted TPR repeat methyltransferase